MHLVLHLELSWVLWGRFIFPPYLDDLGFRSDSAGIGDSVDALILGLASMSLGALNNSDSSALMDVWSRIHMLFPWRCQASPCILGSWIFR